MGHQKKVLNPDRAHTDPNVTEIFDVDWSEGHYIFAPEWSDPLPKNFGKLNKEISYQHGDLVEQWIITYEDTEKNE